MKWAPAPQAVVEQVVPPVAAAIDINALFDAVAMNESGVDDATRSAKSLRQRPGAAGLHCGGGTRGGLWCAWCFRQRFASLRT
jgi:hypothetical protein